MRRGAISTCFNTSIAGIEEADAILLIGSNPRREAPVLNARIRKRWLAGGMPIGLIGERGRSDLSTCEWLGDRRRRAGARCAMARTASRKALREAKKPMMIVGQARSGAAGWCRGAGAGLAAGGAMSVR